MKITKKELLQILKSSKRYNDGVIDIESTHIMADEALLDYIDDIEIAKAFNKIDKRYA